ncbi:hypothetical protein [Mycobacterium sp. 1245852.3]|uniref:hypothetical protein n=1 Tax=Mycobacterium sp. 1245852.3 TaxID=1856860 RepID=UPI0012EAD6F7|nr:hypothetical protein [Mycobacterium sp. 1245852.3]
MPKLFEGFGPAVGACSLRSSFLVNGVALATRAQGARCRLRNSLSRTWDLHSISVDHPVEAIAINRGGSSGDPAIQAIITEELNAVVQLLINHRPMHGASA